MLFTFTILTVSFSLTSLSNHASANTDEPDPYLPVVLWHGLFDSCCSPDSTGRMITLIQENLPGVYVHSLKIGRTKFLEEIYSFFMDANKQVTLACNMIKRDPGLAHGYNAVGFSQGAQFLRAVAQRCPEPRMYNLVSIGGQHQGIYGVPKCWLCNKIKMFKLLKTISYWYFIRNHITCAQLWHNPFTEEVYRNTNTFIADINNERNDHPEYKKNLLKLNMFVMVIFWNDNTVVPKHSSWFEFYTPGQDKEITPLQQSDLFIEDRIGLQELKNSQRLGYVRWEEDHLDIYDELFISDIIEPFLDIRMSSILKN